MKVSYYIETPLHRCYKSSHKGPYNYHYLQPNTSRACHAPFVVNTSNTVAQTRGVGPGSYNTPSPSPHNYTRSKRVTNRIGGAVN